MQTNSFLRIHYGQILGPRHALINEGRALSNDCFWCLWQVGSKNLLRRAYPFNPPYRDDWLMNSLDVSEVHDPGMISQQGSVYLALDSHALALSFCG